MGVGFEPTILIALFRYIYYTTFFKINKDISYIELSQTNVCYNLYLLFWHFNDVWIYCMEKGGIFVKKILGVLFLSFLAIIPISSSVKITKL